MTMTENINFSRASVHENVHGMVFYISATLHSYVPFTTSLYIQIVQFSFPQSRTPLITFFITYPVLDR